MDFSAYPQSSVSCLVWQMLIVQVECLGIASPNLGYYWHFSIYLGFRQLFGNIKNTCILILNISENMCSELKLQTWLLFLLFFIYWFCRFLGQVLQFSGKFLGQQKGGEVRQLSPMGSDVEGRLPCWFYCDSLIYNYKEWKITVYIWSRKIK